MDACFVAGVHSGEVNGSVVMRILRVREERPGFAVMSKSEGGRGLQKSYSYVSASSPTFFSLFNELKLHNCVKNYD